MHKSRLAALVIDSQVENVAMAAEFWGKALGYRAIRPDHEGASRYIHLDTPKEEVQVLVQKVDHPSRVHLDIETDDIQAEVQRLEALGAKIVNVLERWTVMEAPTGHRFCVVNPQRPDFSEATNINIWE